MAQPAYTELRESCRARYDSIRHSLPANSAPMAAKPLAYDLRTGGVGWGGRARVVKDTHVDDMVSTQQQ